MNRRKLFLLLLAAVLLPLVVLATVLGQSGGRAWLSKLQPLPVGGRIALPTLRGLTIYDLADRSETVLVPTTADEVVSAVAWSPDGSQIAYGLYHRRPGDSTGVVELYLVGADGEDPRPLAERDRPGTALDNPVWSPDGRDIYFTYYGVLGNRVIPAIERIAVVTGERSVVVEDGYSPAISPDGQSLLFVRDSRVGSGLWLMPLSGGAPEPVIQPGRWVTIGVPRFSSDGRRIAVSLPNTATGQQGEPGPWAWLLPQVAYAHGEAADIWAFDLPGGDGRRITGLLADDPTPVWSPDDRYIALWSGNGLHLVGSDGGESRELLNRGGYGSIDWRP